MLIDAKKTMGTLHNEVIAQCLRERTMFLILCVNECDFVCIFVFKQKNICLQMFRFSFAIYIEISAKPFLIYLKFKRESDFFLFFSCLEHTVNSFILRLAYNECLNLVINRLVMTLKDHFQSITLQCKWDE